MKKKETIIGQFESSFGRWVIKFRWWIICITILFVCIATYGIRYITFNNDTRVFFSDKNPQLQAFESLENTYNKITNVLFVIAPKDGDVFSRETLAAVEDLTKDSWHIPFSSRVNSITNFQHIEANGDDILIEDLVQNAHNFSDDDIEIVKEVALKEPELVNNLISPSGHVTGVSVNIMLPGESMTEVSEVTSSSRQLIREFNEKYPQIELYLTGSVIIDNAFGEVSQKDMSSLVPLMFVILIFIVGLALRSFVGIISTFVIILISMFVGLGFAGWNGMEITSASVNAPLIILTLAVADSVHILATLFHHLRQGKSKREAIIESLRINFQPVFLTSITTAIGFLTMNFSDAPPFRDLGNIVCMGVLAALVFSLTFLPAFLAVLPIRITSRNNLSKSVFDKLSEWVIQWRKPIFGGTLISIAILSIGIAKIEFNDDFIKYFSPGMEIRVANDFTEEYLSGGDVIEYSLESGEPGGINRPEYLAVVDSFSNWYRQQSKVVHVNALPNTIKRLNKSMHGDDHAYYAIPQQRDLAAQYLLLYEMSLPYGLDLNDQINVDKSSTRMLVSLKNANARELREMDEKARIWLKENAPVNMFTYGSGLSIIWAHISKRNINSMMGASFGALIIISILLMFALKSFRHGLLSLAPNLLPPLMAFGVWGLFVGQVGLGLSIVVAMTLGIVVDDTVHFMSKYLRARREYNMEPINAVRFAFNTVGTAMWVTTVALMAGFMVLTFSGYRMNSDMGLVSALTIFLAFGLDILLLPALLLIFDVKSKINTKAMKNVKLIPVRQYLKNSGTFLILLFALIPICSNGQSAENKGLEIARKADLRDVGFGDLETNVLMVLKNKNGKESTRQIRIRTLEVVGDGDKSLVIFDNPKDVKGTAFLNFTHKVGDDDQWLYLPALKRVKRISSQNKSGSFMGSEFAYEDFASQEVEKYTYKWLRDEIYENIECYVVERYPVDQANSGYIRQVTWVDKKEYRLLKVDFYDRKDSLLKTLTTDGYHQYQDKYWRAEEMHMLNHQNNKSTSLKFSDYQFGNGLTENDFNTNSLARVK
jgi:predicted RND superfamily exporter protein/outer membrane lipoprotein-sorting protein